MFLLNFRLESSSILKDLFLRVCFIGFLGYSMGGTQAQNAGLPTYLQVPELQSEQDNLGLLYHVKEFIPDLFAEALRHQVNLGELLLEGYKVRSELLRNPEYIRAVADRGPLLTLKFEALEGEQQVKTLDGEAILKNWQTELLGVLQASSGGSRNFLDNFKSELVERSRWPDSISPLMGALISELLKDSRPQFRAHQDYLRSKVFRFLSLADRIRYLGLVLKGLRDFPLVIFDAESSELKKFSGPKTIQTYGDLFDAILVVWKFEDAALLRLVDLEQIRREGLHSYEDLDTDRFHQVMRSRISNLKISDYYRFGRKNPSELMRHWGLDLSIEVGYRLENLIIQHREREQKKFTLVHKLNFKSVELREVSPLVGMFRGIVAKDCSSSKCFPYPWAPSERTFFVYAGDKKIPKGVVSLVQVKDGRGLDHLYLVNLQGDMDKSMVVTMLTGLDGYAHSLGWGPLMLPEPNRLMYILDQDRPFMDYLLARSEAGVPGKIIYTDNTIRAQLESFKNFNVGDYDHRFKNQMGRHFRSDSEGVGAIRFHAEPLDQSKIVLPKTGRQELLSYALDLFALNDALAASRVIAAGKFRYADVTNLVSQFKNPHALPVSDFLRSLDAQVSLILGYEHSYDWVNEKGNLVYKGWALAPDAFDEKNIKPLIAWLVEDLKQVVRTEALSLQLPWDLLRQHQNTLAKYPSWNKVLFIWVSFLLRKGHFSMVFDPTVVGLFDLLGDEWRSRLMPSDVFTGVKALTENRLVDLLVLHESLHRVPYRDPDLREVLRLKIAGILNDDECRSNLSYMSLSLVRFVDNQTWGGALKKAFYAAVAKAEAQGDLFAFAEVYSRVNPLKSTRHKTLVQDYLRAYERAVIAAGNLGQVGVLMHNAKPLVIKSEPAIKKAFLRAQKSANKKLTSEGHPRASDCEVLMLRIQGA